MIMNGPKISEWLSKWLWNTRMAIKMAIEFFKEKCHEYWLSNLSVLIIIKRNQIR